MNYLLHLYLPYYATAFRRRRPITRSKLSHTAATISYRPQIQYLFLNIEIATVSLYYTLALKHNVTV